MFRKIVSNLPFSPALVGQLGFYAKRLRKEEATRRLGLIFTALALVVQGFAVIAPPESANAADPNDMIYGGVSNGSQLLAHYDRNTNNMRDLYNTIGITRAEIAQATNNLQYRTNTDGTYSWGMNPKFSASQGEGSYTVKTSTGSRTFHYRPQILWGKYNYSAYVGYSAKFGWFAIMRACGNLVTKTVPPKPQCPAGQTGTYPNCVTPPKKCTIPGKTHLNADDPNCKKDPVATCSSLTVTKNGNNYQFTASGTAENGAKITGYAFKIYRDGKLVKTISGTSATVTYQEKAAGKYKVELTIKTTVGERTAAGCIKEFQIVEPAKCPVNPTLLKDDPRCQPCPGDSTLWLEDKKCSASFVEIKTAQNTTQKDINATSTTAKASDRIIYKLSVTNKGLAPEKYTFKEHIEDVLQYATLLDAGGGELVDNADASESSTVKILTWPTITLKPGETQERIFTVQLLDKIPSMSTGTSSQGSYDCRIDNTFGNTVSINVDCPVEKKVVEQVVSELPHTGPRENIIFAGVTLAVVAYFYARSRQLKKEVRLIRRNFNAGTI